MDNKSALPPNDGTKRSARMLLLGGAGIVLLVPCILIWYAHSAAGKSARLSTLIVLQGNLTAYAQEHGVYPPSCEQAVVNAAFLRHLDPESIVYCAAGLSANNDGQSDPGDRRLFYEKAAKRYGLSCGWFELFERHWCYHEGTAPSESAITAGAAGGEKRSD